MTSKDELRKEIKHRLYLYRVRCDIAFSDREEGVITQAEYHTAIDKEGDLNADAILNLLEGEAESYYKKGYQDAEEDCTAIWTAKIEGEKQKAWISLHQGATCCKDKHQTFYGAVVTSPQWELWQEKQSKNPTRDMAEVEELGVMSSDHFQEFMTFCTKQLQDFHVPGREIGLYRIVERTKEKSHKNRKYKVECLKCGKELFRYSNKFRVKHKDCYPEKLATLNKEKGIIE